MRIFHCLFRRYLIKRGYLKDQLEKTLSVTLVEKPLLTELALSQGVSSIFLTFFYRTFKLKISLNLKQYYNSRFNEKVIKSFKKSIEI